MKKETFQTIVLLGAGIFAAAYLLSLAYTMIFQPWFIETMKPRLAAGIGLPLAALATMGVVVILEINSGNIKFKGLGFEFEGTSGPIVLWIFVFLSIAGAIKLLW
jgi:hypothetical protein